ncbi:MAG: alpha/beta hydrolase [Ferruginibacter sp.]|nr:alpha/beta hydrolase [Ferruginibacter sp.]
MIIRLEHIPGFLTRNFKAVWLHGILLVCSLVSFSQFTVRFQVSDVPLNHLQDSVFVAGSFNDWKPGHTGNHFSKLNEPAFIEINELPAGEYQYKFTRGNWQSVECLADGNDAMNRILNLSADTVVRFSIEAWKDDFPTVARKHTTSPNVQIIDTAFLMPQLGRTRRVWLYLPPGYAKSRQRYPVMYMQDGQNIFDDYTSGFGEWGVDECIDSMVKKGKPACIVVGIDNGPKRLNEYNPYEFKEFGKGEGDQYLAFLVEVLKPFIDKHYRTLTDTENTIIAGSSMGALIAYYAMLKYPDVFGKGGIFSPAFWTAPRIKELTTSSGKNLKGTLFFYIGGREGGKHIKDMEAVTDKLGKHSLSLIYSVTDPDGNHNEQAWRKWFPEFYNWVLANGFNNIIDLETD